jgi:hypothetical protein
MMTNPANVPKPEPEPKKSLGQIAYETDTGISVNGRLLWSELTESQRNWCEQAACNVVQAEYSENVGITLKMGLGEVCYNGYHPPYVQSRVPFSSICHDRQLDWTLAAKAVIGVYRAKQREGIEP